MDMRVIITRYTPPWGLKRKDKNILSIDGCNGDYNQTLPLPPLRRILEIEREFSFMDEKDMVVTHLPFTSLTTILKYIQPFLLFL